MAVFTSQIFAAHTNLAVPHTRGDDKMPGDSRLVVHPESETTTMKALVKKKAEPGLWLEDVPEPTIGINDV
ncbi:MAG: hypothetical protein KDA42_20180, partial [Planctomycetales bacterium]|nr:hypothetical protein [Planctomycetales bacterium]